VLGLNEGEYQLVPALRAGLDIRPAHRLGTNAVDLMGRPPSSKPTFQFCLTKAWPSRNCPLVRSRT